MFVVTVVPSTDEDYYTHSHGFVNAFLPGMADYHTVGGWKNNGFAGGRITAREDK
jgi:hypothetical protein